MAKLNALEGEIQSTELPRHSEALIRRHMDLAAQIQECSVPAIQHGRAILQKVANDAGRGVARKVLEKLNWQETVVLNAELSISVSG